MNFGEPWTAVMTTGREPRLAIHDAANNEILVMGHDGDVAREPMIARAIACVNFCREFPTEVLEGRMLKYIKPGSEIVNRSAADLEGFDGFVAVALTPVVKDKP